jgi:hypothetical protein
MQKVRKYQLYTLGLVLIIPLVIYLLFEVNGFDSVSLNIISNFVNPLFFGSLGLVPTILILLFSSDRIFSSWLKHIAWWFMLVILLMITSNENESSFSNFDSDVWIINMSMGILFIITLVYALIMNRRLKKQGGLA